MGKYIVSRKVRMLTSCYFVVANVFDMPAGGRTPGATDFSTNVRTQACGFVHSKLVADKRIKVVQEKGLAFKRGPGVHPALAHVLLSLQAISHWKTAAEKYKVQCLTHDQLWRLLTHWWPVYFSGQMGCESHKRRKVQLLTEEELKACDILGDPVLRDGSWHFWRSVKEALQSPELKTSKGQRFFKRRGMKTPEAWERHLLSSHKKYLVKVFVDKRDKLTAKTLGERQHAAAVRRGDKPWFTRGEGEDAKEVMWNPDFYEQFAFTLDAGTCADAKGPANVKEMGAWCPAPSLACAPREDRACSARAVLSP
jgi:hypothetical protein